MSEPCATSSVVAMHLDRFGLQAGRRGAGPPRTLAGQYPVAPNFDRGACDDVVGATFSPVVSQSIATTSSAGPGLNMNRYTDR